MQSPSQGVVTIRSNIVATFAAFNLSLSFAPATPPTTHPIPPPAKSCRAFSPYSDFVSSRAWLHRYCLAGGLSFLRHVPALSLPPVVGDSIRFKRAAHFHNRRPYLSLSAAHPSVLFPRVRSAKPQCLAECRPRGLPHAMVHYPQVIGSSGCLAAE